MGAYDTNSKCVDISQVDDYSVLEQFIYDARLVMVGVNLAVLLDSCLYLSWVKFAGKNLQYTKPHSTQINCTMAS